MPSVWETCGSDLGTVSHWYEPAAQPLIFFLRIDDLHCKRIHSSLTAVHCSDDGYVGKQPMALTEYCVENWLIELQEVMNNSTGHHTPFNSIHSIWAGLKFCRLVKG